MFFFLPLYDDNPINRTPVVTYGLIGTCVVVFLWQLGQNSDVVAYTYGMIPAVLFGDARLPHSLAAVPPWVTIFTSMFLHAGWLHIGGNMLFLWIFGNNIEDVLGHFRYLLLYLLSGVAAAMGQALTDPASTVPMLGASGAIAGVLGAYLLLYPNANVHVLVLIIILLRMITVPAWIMLGLWFGAQVVSGLLSGSGAGVAFWAHVGGFVTGIVLLLALRPRRTALWHPPRSARFVAAPPRRFAGRRTFHGSVPDSGASPFGRRRGPWG
ncbi:MAG TPA: rhomboid family intramembrane serine protease [Stellaceae bacterium]|nr:rhomboid family intramembrane serine protease [Stellaceae bacterium]